MVDHLNDLPGIVSCFPVPRESQSSTPLASGAVTVAETGRTIWTLPEIRTRVLSSAEMQQWEAFIARSRGQQVAFTVSHGDPLRRVPAAGASYGTPVLDSVDAENRTITLSGMTPTFVLTAGDTVSYTTESGGLYFGMVDTNATVAGPGTVTAQVYPAPVTPHASSPAPLLTGARMLARLVPDSYRPEQSLQRQRTRRVVLSAYQVVGV
jgi:hypothetical protein